MEKLQSPILFYIPNLGVGFIGIWIFYAVAVKILKRKSGIKMELLIVSSFGVILGLSLGF